MPSGPPGIVVVVYTRGCNGCATVSLGKPPVCQQPGRFPLQIWAPFRAAQLALNRDAQRGDTPCPEAERAGLPTGHERPIVAKRQEGNRKTVDDR